MGFLDSLFGGGSQTTTSSVDPRTAAYINQLRQMLMRQGTGPNAFQSQAGTGYGQLLGNLGFGMQTGLEGLDQYMDPYLSQVIGGVQGDFDRQRGIAASQAQQAATQAGAYGGSRSAVLQSLGQRDINQLEGQQLGQLRSQGFGNAVNALFGQRAQALNAGLAGLGGLTGLGGQMDANQWARYQGLLGLTGPTSQTQSTQNSTSPFGQLLGAGLSIGSMFLPGAGGLGALGAAGPAMGVASNSAGYNPGVGWQGWNPNPWGGFGVQGGFGR